MKVTATEIPGVLLVAAEPVRDERGAFSRLSCERELAAHGANGHFVQTSLSSNLRAGTLRGLHFQRAPFAEEKLVRCLRGAAYDVVVDLRQGSPTRLRWLAVELTPGNGLAVYVPKGCAHGFMTLSDDTELLYQITEEYQAEAAAGIRWDDPAVGIRWPAPGPVVISPRDASYPRLEATP